MINVTIIYKIYNYNDGRISEADPGFLKGGASQAEMTDVQS